MQLVRFLVRHYHTISIASFVVGFTVDSIFLKRIDTLTSLGVLSLYLALAGVSILAMQKVIHLEWYRVYALPLLPFVAQYAFGGLFSGFLIFYTQAGSLSGSWPYLGITLTLIIINEFYSSFHSRLSFQLGLYYFCIFSVSIFAVPMVLGSIGEKEFVISGLVSLGVFGAFLLLVFATNRARFFATLRESLLSVLTLYVGLHALYFLNYLPPIPLALKEGAVVHSVEKVGTEYLVSAFTPSIYEKLFGLTLTGVRSEELFYYSAAFAPTNIKTPIQHLWEWYDEGSGVWVQKSTISFPIVGGRDSGYRGYSSRPIDEFGLWRVTVQTADGRILGRTRFWFEEQPVIR